MLLQIAIFVELIPETLPGCEPLKGSTKKDNQVSGYAMKGAVSKDAYFLSLTI